MSDATVTSAGDEYPSQRRVNHRGTPACDRFHFARTSFRCVETVFPAGRSIEASVVELLRHEGCVSGIIELSGGWLDPFDFVIPADDPRGQHAVWYSDTRSLRDGGAIECASCSVGRHGGKTFLHCHGLWRSADGQRYGGHLLTGQNRIVEPVRVKALLASDAWFERRFDEETNFDLFAVAGGGSGDGLLATLRPNQDLTAAIENVAKAANIESARIHGVGSVIDLTLADGRISRSLAHEVAITAGEIVADAGGIKLGGLAVAGVGMEGIATEGLLKRGCNPVCVTFELALVSQDF